MPNYEALDEIGQLFARALFSEFPNWESLARFVTDQATGDSWIEIDIQQEGTDRALHLSTAKNEITIGFDGWHTHIGTFLGINVEESVATAMGIILDFIAEVRIVYVVYRAGAWLHSGFRFREMPLDPEPDTTTKIFSWRQTYDREIETT